MTNSENDSSDFETTFTYHYPTPKARPPVLDRSQWLVLYEISDGEDHPVNIPGMFKAERDLPDTFKLPEHAQRVVWTLVQQGLVGIRYLADGEEKDLEIDEAWKAFVPGLWTYPPEGDYGVNFFITEKGMDVWVGSDRAKDWLEVIDWNKQPMPPIPEA